jgi:dTDP-4-dehydrorhamnose 3,5-epimerase
MMFTNTRINGAFVITPGKIDDERGFFTETFNKSIQNFHEMNITRTAISCNKRCGTIRGVHYQVSPCEETKIVSCTKGSIFDVIVDMRKDSPTYYHWIWNHISEHSNEMILVPKGCAHGFQTLADNSIVQYFIDGEYKPECARGIRWNDPYIGILWPVAVTNISEKDQEYSGVVS